MNLVIFCGGSGKRLWPLSREKSPKQLNQSIFNGRSTFQMQVERALKVAPPENIYITTTALLSDQVKEQALQIPHQNFIVEPIRRDLAPAVGLVNALLEKLDPRNPYAILWSDHIVQRPTTFAQVLRLAASLTRENPHRIIFIGQKAHYAEENLGYIGLGKEISLTQLRQDQPLNVTSYTFKDWHYRPSKERAEEFIASGKYVWNTGYFVTTPVYLAQKYIQFAPEMYTGLQKIAQHFGTPKWQPQLKRIYPTLEEISFDDKIITHIPPHEALVLVADLGWHDPGSLYALKKLLEKKPGANIIRGHSRQLNCRDTFILNHSNDKLVVGLGLDGHIIVNTDDAILVVEKTHVPKIKELLKSFKGTKNEKYL